MREEACWHLARPDGDEAGWAVLEFRRPERLNALREKDLRDLERVWEGLEKESHLRVVLVAGQGRAFSAGADLEDMASHQRGEGAWDLARLGQAVFHRIAQSPLLSLAVIRGFALGGGLELALALDFRLAAVSARLGLPEVRLGLVPGFGGTQRLPRLVGESRALWLIASGSTVSGEEASRLGLVDWVVADDQLWPEAYQRARQLAEQPAASLQAAKALVRRPLGAWFERGLADEAGRFQALVETEEARTRIQAFLARRGGKESSERTPPG
ncbi:MAG: enoyl-CoA hydratase/isomerase family protein [Firmicutes bacterium]|nr:enoyl-CoA hydratase/isomerase family protein [Bacillota bacterium]